MTNKSEQQPDSVDRLANLAAYNDLRQFLTALQTEQGLEPDESVHGIIDRPKPTGYLLEFDTKSKEVFASIGGISFGIKRDGLQEMEIGWVYFECFTNKLLRLNFATPVRIDKSMIKGASDKKIFRDSAQMLTGWFISAIENRSIDVSAFPINLTSLPLGEFEYNPNI